MKTIVLNSRTLVMSITICLLFVCMQAISARNSKSFVYDKSDEKETVFVYDSVSCMLTPHLRYEFNESENGRTKTKTAYRWNESSGKWIPYYLLTTTDTGEYKVHEFARWNNKKKDFSMNKQKAVYYKESNENVPGYISFKWNEKSSKWEIIDGEYFENFINLMVNTSAR
ncbi:DUF3836 domain-containing protein [Bacteroides sedimenti]|uniref:DUF3836 domain-containing protein n=1 Tax=Bacteroides sedimenti TaxID=2136147 RepID=A0ABM8I9C3_9BACE